MGRQHSKNRALSITRTLGQPSNYQKESSKPPKKASVVFPFEHLRLCSSENSIRGRFGADRSTGVRRSTNRGVRRCFFRAGLGIGVVPGHDRGHDPVDPLDALLRGFPVAPHAGGRSGHGMFDGSRSGCCGALIGWAYGCSSGPGGQACATTHAPDRSDILDVGGFSGAVVSVVAFLTSCLGVMQRSPNRFPERTGRLEIRDGPIR